MARFDSRRLRAVPPVAWAALGSIATVVIGGSALFAFREGEPKPAAAVAGADAAVTPVRPAVPEPQAPKEPVAAELPKPVADAPAIPKPVEKPTAPALPEAAQKVEPAETPAAKRERVSLEDEWGALSRFKAATTDTVNRDLHVTSLTVRGDAVDADFVELKKLPHVKRLVVRGGREGLEGDKVTDAAFEHVATLGRLEELDATGLQITDEACKHIDKLKALRVLRLSDTRVSDDGLKVLKSLTKLEVLELAGTTVSGEGLAGLNAKGLKSLDLRCVPLRTADLKVVGRFAELRVLLLPDVEVTDWFSIYGTPIKSVGGLPKRRYDEKPLEKGSIDYVQGLGHLSGLVNLERVDMTRVFPEEGQNRGEAALTDLSSIGGYFNSPLDDLKKSPYGVLTMLGLKRSANGTWLAKGDSTMQRDAQGKVPLSEVRPEFAQFVGRRSGSLLELIKDYRNVKSLDLSGFLVADDDLVHLAKQVSLERLDLSGSPITAKGLGHLKSLPKLRYLNLRGASVGDGDIAAIREIKGLRDVVLSQTKVTADGAEAFRRGALRAVYDPKQQRPWWCDIDWRAELAKFSAPDKVTPAPKGADTGMPEKAASKVDVKALPDYYPLVAGAAWEYEMGNQTLVTKVTETATEGATRTATVSTHVDGKFVSSEVIRVEEKGVYRLKMNQTSFEPPVMIFKFGVEPEATWGVRAKLDQGTAVFAFSFKGEEELKVPAGTYKVAKVEGNATQSGTKIDTAVFYAKGVGIVRTDLTIDGRKVAMALRKFTPGVPNPAP